MNIMIMQTLKKENYILFFGFLYYHFSRRSTK